MDSKLSTNQKYALVAKKAKSLWGCTGQGVVKWLSEVIVPSAVVRYLWVLNPVLGSPIPERHDHTILSTENSYKDDKGADASFIQEARSSGTAENKRISGILAIYIKISWGWG